MLRRICQGWGAELNGIWPVTRGQAVLRLEEFTETGRASFGHYEDVTLTAEWKLAHSCLSSSINHGLLPPGELIAAAEDGYTIVRRTVRRKIVRFLRRSRVRRTTEWIWVTFVDGAEWVMALNVVGMALFADGGQMATKPYASGGAYLNRMSDSCRSCRYNPKRRTSPDACPFTTLYWDLLNRNHETLRSNHRLSRQLAGLDRLPNLEETRDRAQDVLGSLILVSLSPVRL